MRAIPVRTDPLSRATMPAITSTAAMIHRMGVGVAAAPLREHPENSEHAPSLLPGDTIGGLAGSLTP